MMWIVYLIVLAWWVSTTVALYVERRQCSRLREENQKLRRLMRAQATGRSTRSQRRVPVQLYTDTRSFVATMHQAAKIGGSGT